MIESVLIFNISVWFGTLTLKNRNRLSRIVNTASKIVGAGQLSLTDLYNMAVRRKARAIVADKSHPLSEYFKILPSGRRYKSPIAKKNTFRKSFLPMAVSI